MVAEGGQQKLEVVIWFQGAELHQFLILIFLIDHGRTS